MAASYPASLPVKDPAGANLSTNPHSALHDGMYDEIVAIATELGTNPKGTAASVKARFDAMTLGKIAYAQITAGSTTFVGTEITITGLEVTWTAVTGRLYKISIGTDVTSTVADDEIGVKICDSSNVQKHRGTTVVGLATVSGVDKNMTLNMSYVESGLSGSVTRRVRALRSAGTGTCQITAAADRPAFILVEDIGLA